MDVSMQQERRDFIPQSDVVVESRDSQVTKEYFSTLESSVTTPPDVLAQDPLHVIRWERREGGRERERERDRER